MDGRANYATKHIVTDDDGSEIKKQVREELRKHNIVHATLKLEAKGEPCSGEQCHFVREEGDRHHHHGHHHRSDCEGHHYD